MPKKARVFRPSGQPPRKPFEQAARLPNHDRLYGRKWKVASKAFLADHPLCVECEKAGRFVPATVVDHVKPHRGDEVLFWDEDNWQGLCDPHHRKKIARGQ